MAGMPYIVTKGIVLRETETKETDKILTLLTAERGKISVIARGARRKNCRFAASAQSLVYSEWTLYQRGNWYYVNEGTTLELFQGLQKDLDAMALGFYFAELTECVSLEEQPSAALLSHLLNGLYALGHWKKPLPLVKAAFEVKLLALSGYEPLVDGCVYCGCLTPERPFLDVVQGVLRCDTCGTGERMRALPLCQNSLAALRHVLYGDPKRLYSFTLGGEALQRFSMAAERFTLTQLERGFKTLDFYRSLQPTPPEWDKNNNET